MSLSEKEKKQIDEIENAVRKDTPVENLKKDRKDRDFEKLCGKVPPAMGYMVPPPRREPGMGDMFRLFLDLMLGKRPMMGVMVPHHHGDNTPRPPEEDEPSEDGPESEKKKPGKDGNRES